MKNKGKIYKGTMMKSVKIILLGLFVYSCGQPNLNPLKETIPVIHEKHTYGEVEVDFCLLQDQLATDVKTLFMLDRSASNCDEGGNCGNGVNGTDRERLRRTEGILDYARNHKFKLNEYFALMEFRCDDCTGSDDGSSGTRNPDAQPILPGAGTGLNLTPQNDFYPFMRNMESEGFPFNDVVNWHVATNNNSFQFAIYIPKYHRCYL